MPSALVALENNGQASVISYNVPDPTSYSGRLTVGLNVAPGYFKAPSTAVFQSLFDIESVTKSMKNGFDDPAMFAGMGIAVNDLAYADNFAPVRYVKAVLYYIEYYSYQLYNGYYQWRLTYTNKVYLIFPYAGVVTYQSRNNVIVLPEWGYGYYKCKGQGNQEFQVDRNGQMAGTVYVAVEYTCTRRYYGTNVYDDNHVYADTVMDQSVVALNPDNVLANLRSGKRLSITRDPANRFVANWSPWNPTPRLALSERFRLSTFHGSYGAGRVIKTFSLLPGEKTTITVKSYLRTTESKKETSSILDSYTQESADDFTSTLSHENSDKQERKESHAWHVEAQAESDWGFVAVEASASYKGGINKGNEQFSKHMSNAVSKHASLASSKRDIKIDQSVDRTTETGTESGVQRELLNINTGRTLNFIFRQMNQEFVSILHLVDVQIAFQSGLPGGLKRYTLAELDSFINEVVADGPDPLNSSRTMKQYVKDRILNELRYIIDYAGNTLKFVESRNVMDANNNVVKDAQNNPVSYYRARAEITSTYTSSSGKSFVVPGIIMAVSNNVMRTSGLIAEALLGEGEGLDSYSGALQLQATRRQSLLNDLQAARNAHDTMLVNILGTQDTVAAQLYAQLYPPALPAAVK